MSDILVEKTLPTGQTVQIARGDITLEKTDAIVNAANEYLQHGGGVAWAIVRRGGDSIQDESDAWIKKYGLVSHSRPAWTSGGTLPARFVIHAVGPVWDDPQSAGAGGDEDQKLADAVTGSLRVADELKCESIAFPAISTGIFGFPKERAAKVIFKAMEDYFSSNVSGLKLARMVLWDDETVQAFLANWAGDGQAGGVER
ncbi:MAG: hypothetical protein JETCAE02_12210 [Anaerolineaceae bacterium]|nr:macro domain-containing protein [Chloroflexota bacterium]MDL1927274.1 macro domain-containing protein [Anaerolineae bacterium AMX1]WKZ53872.1 MAG: macro domain-containing protein [Anaerolineales bacterium]GJQ38809.1 MAG: hypothetical protein JETCAE02_12210 [Anaerolineaceae bacterium]NOG74592.1 macro domain-containing protein [Chloroflexota bacterium]